MHSIPRTLAHTFDEKNLELNSHFCQNSPGSRRRNLFSRRRNLFQKSFLTKTFDVRTNWVRCEEFVCKTRHAPIYKKMRKP